MNTQTVEISNEVEVRSGKLYFPALTGLRALVAWLVFFYHASGGVNTGKLTTPVKWLILLVQQGDIGVSIFFMLSGFLITMRYQQGIVLGKKWFKGYFQNRFARIYPIYFLLTAFAFVVMIVRPSYNWYQWPATYGTADKLVAGLMNLTLTRAFFEKTVFLGMPTAWSLTVEESFYVLAPFLLLGLRYNARRLVLYPIVLLVTGALLVLFCSHFLPYYGLMQNLEFMMVFTFFGRCPDFIVGMWLGLKFSATKSAPWLDGKSTWVASAALILLMLGVSSYVPAWKDYAAGRLLLSVLFTVPTVLLLRGLITEQNWFSRLLSTKLFDLLGKSSYIFYLVHLGIIDTIFMRFVTDSWLARLVTYTGLSIGLYLLVEHPMHELLRAKRKVVATALP